MIQKENLYDKVAPDGLAVWRIMMRMETKWERAARGWFGSMNNYDVNGNKIGESRPGYLGNMNHYDENGHKTGHSDKGILGGWNHFDE